MSNGFKNKKVGRTPGGIILYCGFHWTWFSASCNADPDGGNCDQTEHLESPFIVVGIGMVLIVGVVTMGGIKRIGQVAEVLAPIMCGIYFLITIAIFVMNYKEIPGDVWFYFCQCIWKRMQYLRNCRICCGMGNQERLLLK